jgi:hypothetical protein
MVIQEVYRDDAGKYRAIVMLENESPYFKFDHFPTTEEIEIEVSNYLTSKNQQPADSGGDN